MAQRAARRETSAGGVVVRRTGDGPRYLLILDGYGNWGFPKGHLKRGETPEAAASREIAEETGLDNLTPVAPIDRIDWYFRAKGKLIHKYCHYFLYESPAGEVRPQLDEGISQCAWVTLEEAHTRLAHDNARAVLRRAGDLVAGLR